MPLERLRSHYCGYRIDTAAGNNAFSHDRRRQRWIAVAPLASGTPRDLRSGDVPVFVEIEDGVERICTGLAAFLYWRRPGKDVFIFDNHNHAFAFWAAGIAEGRFPAGMPLLHVDQHTDMREPPVSPPAASPGDLTIAAACRYARDVLNVGNFIRPALDLGLFSDVQIIDSSAAFDESVPERVVLDLDMDIFSDDMAYIDEELKLERIRAWLERSPFVTVATSPFFMPQERAIALIRTLFASDHSA